MIEKNSVYDRKKFGVWSKKKAINAKSWKPRQVGWFFENLQQTCLHLHHSYCNVTNPAWFVWGTWQAGLKRGLLSRPTFSTRDWAHQHALSREKAVNRCCYFR